MGEVKIGLEIHGYLNMENKSKLFCNCRIDHDAEPNTKICPVCTGQPGSKPMLANMEAVDKIISIALMLNCKINDKLLFQRKHYSWPDLPNGFQKTMSGSYAMPVGLNGEFLGIGIEEIHLEEDPARWDPGTGTIDYNRCGFPLVEIVTKPDFKSTDEVEEWLKKLMTTLSYIRAVDRKAGIKSDVNVSIAPKFIRTEVKNVNSFSSIIAAIKFEIERQSKEKKNILQTRAWDDSNFETVFMRTKETAQDYMFIPEPDLPIIHVDPKTVKHLKSELPEHPSLKLKRYLKLGIDKVDAETISSEIVLAELFDNIIKQIDPVFASKWFRRDIIAAINTHELEYDELDINPDYLVDWFKLLQSNEISPVVAKDILEKFVKENFDVKEYVGKQNLTSVSDDAELNKLCEEAIKHKPEAVEDFGKGNDKALNAVVGYVMQKTQGKADPKKVNDIIRGILK